MQALPTTKPAPEEEGTVRECPICLEEVAHTAQGSAPDVIR